MTEITKQSRYTHQFCVVGKVCLAACCPIHVQHTQNKRDIERYSNEPLVMNGYHVFLNDAQHPTHLLIELGLFLY